MKNPLKKREPKSKEALLFEMKQKQDAQRKRQFITEKFFPLLKERTIHQAKQMCKIVQNDMMSSFNEGMRNTVGSLNMKEKLGKEEGEDDASAAYRALLDAFAELPIGEALEIIGGMPQAIEGAMNVEDRNRPMSQLEWDDGTMRIKPTPDIVALCEKAQCRQFQQLGNGNWYAYSDKTDDKGVAIRAPGVTPLEAVEHLLENL